MPLTRLPYFDGLELLTLDAHRVGFPEHFHDTFCITLVTEGVERIATAGRLLHGERGTITITHPGEVHANPGSPTQEVGGAAGAVSFTTLYLPQDAVDWLGGRSGIRFEQQCRRDPELVRQFQKFTTISASGTERELVAAGRALFGALTREQCTRAPAPHSLRQRHWEALGHHIDSRLYDVVTIDELARVMHMSRFHFAKQFRVHFGMSPINYVLMRKVFAAKERLGEPGQQLTRLAYTYGFSDQAHFSRTFKRFVGLSPRQYLRQLRYPKIVQV